MYWGIIYQQSLKQNCLVVILSFSASLLCLRAMRRARIFHDRLVCSSLYYACLSHCYSAKCSWHVLAYCLEGSHCSQWQSTKELANGLRIQRGVIFGHIPFLPRCLCLTSRKRLRQKPHGMVFQSQSKGNILTFRNIPKIPSVWFRNHI